MRPGWLNDGANRSFPFLRDSTGVLPYSAIVDFGCLMGIDSGFEYGDDVYLQQIVRDGDVFTFEFRTSASGLADHQLRFTRNLTDPEYSTEYADGTRIDEEPADDTCEISSTWSGYLTTGDLSELADLLPDGNSLVRSGDDLLIEPSLVQNGRQAFVRSINLANDNRTRAATPEGCRDYCWSNLQDEAVLFVDNRCLTGQVRFKQGFNCAIVQNDAEATLTINARVQGGAGEPCEEVPLFPSEAPPAGATLLSGGPSCHEVLRSINGVGGRLFTVYGGSGVRVTPHPTDNKLIVDIDMKLLALCATFEDILDCPDESAVSDSSDDPLWGPREVAGAFTVSAFGEISGLTFGTQLPNTQRMFAIEDSGNPPQIHAITTAGELLQSYLVTGGRNVDYEAVSSCRVDDEHYLYVADIGDNFALRDGSTDNGSVTDLPAIYRCREPIVPEESGGLLADLENVEKINLEYPGGPRDAETLIVDRDTGDMYIFTKQTEPQEVYRLLHQSSYSGTQTLEFVGELTVPLDTNGMGLTDGSLSYDGLELILRRRDVLFHWIRAEGEALADLLLREPDGTVDTFVSELPDGESVCWSPDNRRIYVTPDRSGIAGAVIAFYERLNCTCGPL